MVWYIVWYMLCYMMFKPRGVIAAIAPPPSITSSLNKTLNLLFQVLQSCNVDEEAIKKIMYISRDLFFRSMMIVLMIGQWLLIFTEMITYITNKAHWLNMFAFNMLSYMVFTFRSVVTAIAVPHSFRRFYDVTLNLLLQVFISLKNNQI